MNIMQAWVTACTVLVAVMLVPAAKASMYEDILMEDLMKRLSGFEDDPYDQDGAAADWYSDNIPLDVRDNGETSLRDQEYLEHSASHQGGFQYIQGGAGEGKQHLTPSGLMPNSDVVKSDESLPFYCHPPNPCPKGYTEEDGCQPFIEDTAESQKEWIDGMMQRGMCTCDEEHMFNCPKNMPTMNNEKGQTAKNDLDKMLDSLLNDKSNYINPYGKGDKRFTLVAKKAPIVKRSIDASKRFSRDNYDINRLPYWMQEAQGDAIHTVVKKDGRQKYDLPML